MEKKELLKSIIQHLDIQWQNGVPINEEMVKMLFQARNLSKGASVNKYDVQMTVVDERNGALSGSTLKEACSWGKVDVVHEQMVYVEKAIAFPLLAGYAYHEAVWKERVAMNLNSIFKEAAIEAN